MDNEQFNIPDGARLELKYIISLTIEYFRHFIFYVSEWYGM